MAMPQQPMETEPAMPQQHQRQVTLAKARVTAQRNFGGFPGQFVQTTQLRPAQEGLQEQRRKLASQASGEQPEFPFGLGDVLGYTEGQRRVGHRLAERVSTLAEEEDGPEPAREEAA